MNKKNRNIMKIRLAIAAFLLLNIQNLLAQEMTVQPVIDSVKVGNVDFQNQKAEE